MTSAASVVIVEDHTLLGESLAFTLRAEGLDVTMARLDSAEVVTDTVTAHAPCLVLLDLDLGEVIGDGVDLIPGLTALGATVLVVSGVESRLRLASAVAAGAVGFVSKLAPFAVLVDTAVRAAAGGCVLDANDRHALLGELRRHRAEQDKKRSEFETLSPREQQVLAAISDGKTVEAIATEWVVSTATVRTQVRGVLTKLDVCSQLAAVAKARRNGWLVDR